MWCKGMDRWNGSSCTPVDSCCPTEFQMGSPGRFMARDALDGSPEASSSNPLPWCGMPHPPCMPKCTTQATTHGPEPLHCLAAEMHSSNAGARPPQRPDLSLHKKMP
jgi:hypothetical protein